MDGRDPDAAHLCKCAGCARAEGRLGTILAKQLAILAIPMLSACAMPGIGAGTSGSFLGGAHPSQEFCASRGYTLDPTTKQCAPPSQATQPAAVSPAPAETTGSVPQNSQNPTTSSQTKATQAVPSPAPVETTGSVPQNSQNPTTSSQTKATQAVPSPAPVATLSPLSANPVPPPHERERAVSLAPVEPDAVIYAELKDNVDLMTELTHYVHASGYRCDSVSALAPLAYARGYKFVCNHFNYKYAIEDKDGRTVVTLQ